MKTRAVKKSNRKRSLRMEDVHHCKTCDYSGVRVILHKHKKYCPICFKEGKMNSVSMRMFTRDKWYKKNVNLTEDQVKWLKSKGQPNQVIRSLIDYYFDQRFISVIIDLHDCKKPEYKGCLINLEPRQAKWLSSFPEANPVIRNIINTAMVDGWGIDD